jgi:hypothetical protein
MEHAFEKGDADRASMYENQLKQFEEVATNTIGISKKMLNTQKTLIEGQRKNQLKLIKQDQEANKVFKAEYEKTSTRGLELQSQNLSILNDSIQQIVDTGTAPGAADILSKTGENFRDISKKVAREDAARNITGLSNKQLNIDLEKAKATGSISAELQKVGQTILAGLLDSRGASIQQFNKLGMDRATVLEATEGRELAAVHNYFDEKEYAALTNHLSNELGISIAAAENKVNAMKERDMAQIKSDFDKATNKANLVLQRTNSEAEAEKAFRSEFASALGASTIQAGKTADILGQTARDLKAKAAEFNKTANAAIKSTALSAGRFAIGGATDAGGFDFNAGARAMLGLDPLSKPSSSNAPSPYAGANDTATNTLGDMFKSAPVKQDSNLSSNSYDPQAFLTQGRSGITRTTNDISSLGRTFINRRGAIAPTKLDLLNG